MVSMDVSKLRQHLTSEATELQRELADLEAASAPPEFDENFADSGQVAAEQGENHTLAANLREHLQEVEAAVARLDSGSYGTCEACGGPIGEARLEAMPSARFCIDHA